MTSRRFRSGFASAFWRGVGSVVFAGIALSAAGLPARAESLLPTNFFDRIPATQSGQAGVEADELNYNSSTGVITAAGNVGLSYVGYYATSDHMIFNQITRELVLEGNVNIVDPEGVEYTADKVTVTNGFKDAVLNAMIMTTPDGATVTGSQTRKVRGEVTTIDDGIYAPCGTCMDAKGRRIGWRVRTEKIVQNSEDRYTDLDQPILEVLGVPVAWFPWMRLPDMTQEDGSGFRTPSTAYSEKVGFKASLPYYYSIGSGMGLLLTPSLISQQGLLMGAQFSQKFAGLGSYSVTAHGIYQLDPGAFNPGFGDTETRGSIQTSGKFTPVKNWETGWSYTAFTDPAFLTDYLIDTPSPAVNEVYVSYLSPQTFGDARVQEFRLLGEVTQASQDKQAALLPKLRVDHVEDLGDNGTVHASGDFIGVARAADQVSNNAIAYRLGTEEQKTHGTGEADWSRQFILGPSVITPMAGLRLDYATYNGASALQPGAQTLFSATPIAALDVRVPFVAYDGASSHLIEPVAQIYYRGGDTAPGITNDNAQSFTFDEANLFSYNKFSGTDRQETGLRANLGVHYLANFADGSYLDAVAGQTYHLAGFNGLNTADAVNAGVGAGVSGDASDIVAGVRAGMGPVTLSARARYDIAANEIAAAATRVDYSKDGWSASVDYSYMAPDPARGYTGVQQDIGGSIGIPIADYWTATAGLGWDITAGKIVSYDAGLVYDDGYFQAGIKATSSGPTVYDQDALAYKLTFRLKGPDGSAFGS